MCPVPAAERGGLNDGSVGVDKRPLPGRGSDRDDREM